MPKLALSSPRLEKLKYMSWVCAAISLLFVVSAVWMVFSSAGSHSTPYGLILLLAGIPINIIGTILESVRRELIDLRRELASQLEASSTASGSGASENR